MHKNLGMTPYKVQLGAELKTIDYPKRFYFAKLACDQLTEDADFGKKKVVFSDEAHFNVAGYINKDEYIEKPKHSNRLTVWRGFLIIFL